MHECELKLRYLLKNDNSNMARYNQFRDCVNRPNLERVQTEYKYLMAKKAAETAQTGDVRDQGENLLLGRRRVSEMTGLEVIQLAKLEREPCVLAGRTVEQDAKKDGKLKANAGMLSFSCQWR